MTGVGRGGGWWPRRRSLALDVAIALGVLLAAVTRAYAEPPLFGQRGASLALAGAVSAVVLVRRRLPALVLLLAAVDTAAFPGTPSAALPVGAYALARYEDRRELQWTWLAIGSVAVLRPWTLDAFEEAGERVFAGGFLMLLPAAVGAYSRARVQLMAALLERAERAEAQQELLARKAVLEERARIAREMHDVVGHRVSLMVLQSGAIEMAATDPRKVEQLASQVQQAGRQALEELRQLVGLLRTEDAAAEAIPLAPQPTLADLEDLVSESRRAEVDVALERRGEQRPLDAVVERAAYRVVQEALTNAGKHAPGASVRVVLEYRPDELMVRVINRRATRPAPLTQPLPSGGHGLVGLRERVHAVGGRLHAEPRLDGGFDVEAVLPG